MTIQKADLNLPLAARNRAWDAAAADRHVRGWAGAREKPNTKYKKAFFWVDMDKKENFTAHKLQFADIVDGELKAVPRGVFAVAAVLQGARGGVDIPARDVPAVKRGVERYYYRMRRVFDDEKIIVPWKK